MTSAAVRGGNVGRAGLFVLCLLAVPAGAAEPPPWADLEAIGLAAGLGAPGSAAGGRTVVLFHPRPGSADSASAFRAVLDERGCPVALDAAGEPEQITDAATTVRGTVMRGSGRARVQLQLAPRTGGGARGPTAVEVPGEGAFAVERAARAALARLGIACRP